MKRNIIVLIVVMVVELIAILLLLKACEGDVTGGSSTASDTVEVIHTIHHCDTISVPKPYAQTVYKTDTMHVDTAAIIAAFYTEKRYNPSYKDSNIELKTDIAIFGNELKDFRFDYDIFQKEKIITNTTTKTRAEVFSFQIGGGISYNLINRSWGGVIGAGANIQRSCINVNYDFINQSLMADYKYKIFTIKK